RTRNSGSRWRSFHDSDQEAFSFRRDSRSSRSAFAHGARMSTVATSAVSKATRVRWGILACVVMITVLTYIDRLNLSIAGKYIQDELSFSTQTMGWVLSAFLLGYSLFQIPGGWAADRFGPKNVLTAAILLWSVFTALTGLAPGLPISRWIGVAGAFMFVRFLVGM